VMLLELGVPFCFSVFSGTRLLLGLSMLFRVMAGHWLVAWAVYSSAEIVSDAWASSGCLCIALDASRIVCDALCIVFDAWASF